MQISSNITSVSLRVKAENGNEKIYMLNFIKESAKIQETTSSTTTEVTETSSNNNYLKVLEVNQTGLSPAFNKSISSYNLVVGLDVSSLEVTARAENEKAKVEVSGHTYLVEGINTISIIVTAENSEKRVYIINVTKTADLEMTNAALQNLEISGYELFPSFDKDVLEYTIEIEEEVESLGIKAVPVKENAKIEIVGNENLTSGENIILINVTAEDGVTMKTYTIKAIKAGEEIIEEENKLIDKTGEMGGNNMTTIIAIAVIIILAVVFGIFFFLYKKEKGVNKMVDENKTTISGIDEDKK